jgi:hypothetical protein
MLRRLTVANKVVVIWVVILSGLLDVQLLAGHLEQTSQQPLGPDRKYTTIERMNMERLRAVREDRMRYALQRHTVDLKTGYADYRAILHAHAEDSSHTGGTRAEILTAAKKAGVDIIMLTDHVRPGRDFIEDSWRGVREGVLFIPGAEAEGFLAYPMTSIRGKRWDSRAAFIELIKEGGGNIFLSHVEEKLDASMVGLDGLEIYNHHTDVKDEAGFSLWLQSALTDPVRLRQLETALNQLPEEVFGAQQDYLASIIAKWDRETRQQRLTGVAANDCHHNQVFTITAADEGAVEIGYITSRATSNRVTADRAKGVAELVRGRKPGELIARLDFDPCERSMRYVTTHILAERLDEQSVRLALRGGHAYVAHDWLCDPTGFAFIAERAGRLVAVMGDEVELVGGLTLRAVAPVQCVLKFVVNGVPRSIGVRDGGRLDLTEKGVYRVEAWLEVDGEQRPWVYSNPIYVR